MNKLLQRANELVSAIDELNRSSDEYISYYAYIKDFPINSGCLCDDILNAAHNDAVLLAMNGTRGLIEDTINIHYLESRKTEKERIATAQNWFKISNSKSASKNELDGKSVWGRAKDAGKDTKALYRSEYSDFCNYVHGAAARSMLNEPSHRVLLSQKTVVASIKAYANIITCTEKILNIATSQPITDAVSAYLDKYSVTVMNAKLPQVTKMIR